MIAAGGGRHHVRRPDRPYDEPLFFFRAPFLPSSAWAFEDVRGFFFPSFDAFALAFFAVSLPLPFLSAITPASVAGPAARLTRPVAGRCH